MENEKKKTEENKKQKKLLLKRETLRKLNDRALAQVHGGAEEPTDDMSDRIKSKVMVR